MALFNYFLWLSSIPLHTHTHTHTPYHLCPFNCICTFRLLPCLCYCKQCCYEHWVQVPFELWFSPYTCSGVGFLGHMVISWSLDFSPYHMCEVRQVIGEGNGNLLQCSCLENPRDGGAWWAAIYGVSQSRTWLKRLSSSSSRQVISSLWALGFSTMKYGEAPWLPKVQQCSETRPGERPARSPALTRLSRIGSYLWSRAGNETQKELAVVTWSGS